MSSLSTMMSALLYLRVTTLVGRVKARLKRLKQPKYLAGAFVGAAYIYFVFLRRVQSPQGRYGPRSSGGGPASELPTEAFSLFAEIGALVLLVVLIVNWATPRYASLAFTEAEIAFLFPAPVNRRMLVHYRLLASQFGIIFTALIFTVAFGRGQAFGGNPWFHAIGWWLVLALLNLHFTGTSFVYSKLLNRSLTSGKRKAITIAAVWAAVGLIALWTWSAAKLPDANDVASSGAFVSYVAALLHGGPLPWLLALPKLVVAPYFAGNAREFLLAMLPALAILAVHYFWVIHTEVSFEEASIRRAEKRAARVKAVQQGDWRGQPAMRKAKPPPFKLASFGRPELAFLWKNLLATSTFFRPRPLMIMAVIIIAGASWLSGQPNFAPLRLMLTVGTGMVLGATLLLGPQIARQDLRSDLANSDILKTYPLRGWQVVLGELLTPLAILSAITWLTLLAAFLLLPADQMKWLTPSLRGAVALGLAALALPFIAIQLLVPNTAAVVFPAWVQSAANRSERGIEVMGQRLIFMAGQLLITSLALIPAAIAAALVFFIVQWLTGFAVGAALGVAAAFALLSVEAWIGVRWLGSRFEQFDLSTELRP